MKDRTEIENLPASDPNDPGTIEFLKLVDCEPWEVHDIPKHGYPASTSKPKKKSRKKSKTKNKGKMVFTFGKYKGRLIEDVPTGYLEWILKQNPTSRVFANIQKRVADILIGGFESELDREFQQIVRN